MTPPTLREALEFAVSVLKTLRYPPSNDEIIIAANAQIDVAIETARTALASEPLLLAKNQSCGCIVCTCGDEERCHGCGAKHCGTHPVGLIPNPVYASQPPVLVEERRKEES